MRFEYRNAARERPLQQIAAMRASFPQFSYRATRRGGLKWRGTLQPTLDSPAYRMLIVHELYRHPRMWVSSPRLVANPPHVYRNDDNSLCLYWPVEWRWRPTESLARTMVPWAAMWLYFYEVWLIADEWIGPSSPHRTGDSTEEDQ
jgi:hypothetical protein